MFGLEFIVFIWIKCWEKKKFLQEITPAYIEMEEYAQEFQYLCKCNWICLLDCAVLFTWFIDHTFTLNTLIRVYFFWKLQYGESYMQKNFEIRRYDRYENYYVIIDKEFNSRILWHDADFLPNEVMIV